MKRNNFKAFFLISVLFSFTYAVYAQASSSAANQDSEVQSDFTQDESNTEQTGTLNEQKYGADDSQTDTGEVDEVMAVSTEEQNDDRKLSTADSAEPSSTAAETGDRTELPLTIEENLSVLEHEGSSQNKNEEQQDKSILPVENDHRKNATAIDEEDGSETKETDIPLDEEHAMTEDVLITGSNASESRKKISPNIDFYTSGHIFEGGVSAIAESPYNRTVFAAGKDGFVTAYAYPRLKPATFQLSRLQIKQLAAHPKENYIAVYETDGFAVHRIAVWDWAAKREVFKRSFTSSVLSLSWSAQGRYLFIGTASIEGITVLDIRGKQKNIYKTPPGIVLLAASGLSEKKIVTYGETGRLVYADIEKRSIVKQYETENYLHNPELIKNYTRITGYKDGNVFVIKASSGEVLQTYPARSAIFAGRLKDIVPVWIERGAEQNTWILCKGDQKSPVFEIPNNAKITAARRGATGSILGADDGNVYRLEQSKTGEIVIMPLTKHAGEAITDLCIKDNRLYMLTQEALYSASLKDKSTELYLEHKGSERCIPYGKGFLLWSKKHPAPLYYAEKAEESKILYRSREPLNAISVYKDSIAIVHSYSGLVLLNGKTGKKLFTYKAAGLQEAVQIDDTFVLISKSSADTSGRPLFLINIKTEETIPLNLEGALVFSLKAHRGKKQTFSCMRLLFDPKPKTQLVVMSINLKQPKKSSFRTVVSYKAEDLNAFVHEEKDTIITNMGNGGLLIYNKKSRRQQQCKRDYALPYNAVSSKYYVITLNYDGAISWYRKKTGELLMTTQLQMTE